MIIVREATDIHTGLRPSGRSKWDSGCGKSKSAPWLAGYRLLCDSQTVLESLVYRFEHPALSGVHVVGLAWRDGEERGIKG